MAMIKLSTFLISLIVISTVSVLFFTFISGVNEEYSPKEALNEDDFAVYQRLDEMQTNVQAIQEDLENKDDPDTEAAEDKNFFGSALDVIGGFTKSGIATAKLGFESVDTFENVTAEAAEDLPLGASGDTIRIMITSIVIVLLFIGVLLSVFTRREM